MKQSSSLISQRSPQMEESASEHFQHAPLDSHYPTIRVLNVLPGRRGTRIECNLQHIYLADDTHTCLSYMWGEDEANQAILINGKLFQIRKNLYRFLEYARRNGIRGPLWIDAVCINQQDTAERNHQVQQMKEIYSKAKEVLIYPGEASQVRQIQREEKDRIYTGGPPPSSFSLAIRFKLFDLLDHLIDRRDAHEHAKLASKMSQVARNPYWRRVWIIQEVLLAKNASVIIGNDMLNWVDFSTTSKQMTDDRLSGLGSDMAWVYQLGRMYQPKLRDGYHASLDRDKWSLWSFYNGDHPHECTDIRDKIYGLVGICHRGDQININYEEDEISTMLRVVLELQTKPGGTMLFRDLYEQIGILSEILQTQYTLICTRCFWRLPQYRQTMIWPEPNHSDISPVSSVLVVGFNEQRKNSNLRYQQERVASEEPGCQDCARKYQRHISISCSVKAKCSTAMCLQLYGLEDREEYQPALYRWSFVDDSLARPLGI